MKKILGLALAGALSVAALPVVAADYPVKAPPPPIWSWSGFYIGIQGGGATSGTSIHNYGVPAPQDVLGLDGWLFGGTIGWNWQSGIWVVGLEGDWSWTDIKGRQFSPNPAFTSGTQVNSLATVRARAGIASLGSTLFYLTGGVAWAQIDRNDTSPVAPFLLVQGFNRTGWTGGGGVEFMLAPNWTMKGEVLFVDLGTSGNLPAAAGGFAQKTVSTDFFIFRGGLNFKF
jgi:outer membrane immunogenic protein